MLPFFGTIKCLGALAVISAGSTVVGALTDAAIGKNSPITLGDAVAVGGAVVGVILYFDRRLGKIEVEVKQQSEENKAERVLRDRQHTENLERFPAKKNEHPSRNR